jgi:peptide/nickel transport system permease protein
MQAYIAKRLLLALPTLFGVSVIVFLILRAIPGDAALIALGTGASGEGGSNLAAVEELRKQFGLDQPLPVQYVVWIGKVVRGDLGDSLVSKRPVLEQFMNRFPVTIELTIIALSISMVVGLVTGIIAAVKQDTALDYVARLISIVGYSVPSFWLGTMLIVLPAIWWKYPYPLGFVPFPTNPTRNLEQFIFPALALGFALSASVMRFTRAQMLEVLRQDYVRTARAKGLADQLVVMRHSLKNALIPVVTVLGQEFTFLIGGTVVIEAVFGLPGVGTLTLQSISQRDYPQVQANILILAGMFVAVNLLVDLFYGWLDPRIAYS